MKSVNNKTSSAIAGIIFTLLSAGAQAVIETKTVTAMLTIDISEPTCTVSAPDTVNLGVLTPGMKITWLPDVSINVDCGGQDIKHALYMQSQNTQTSQHDGIFLKRKDDNTDTGILLQLEGAESNKFTVDEQHPEAVSSGTRSATYPIKVRVDVPRDAKAGEVGGTVIFKLDYS
ncbi:type 1 fimbrial protein [Escherichia coli]|nr:type 1 fimbrial protein [Escherichia coli]ELQ4184708.1 type 1 fimbrial protein [Escherichia coli]